MMHLSHLFSATLRLELGGPFVWLVPLLPVAREGFPLRVGDLGIDAELQDGFAFVKRCQGPDRAIFRG